MISKELLQFINFSKLSPELLEYIQNELRDTNILASCFEKSQDSIQNIISEISERINPTLNKVLSLASALRGQLKAASAIYGPQSLKLVGFSICNLDSLIELSSKFLNFFDSLIIRLAECMKNTRDLLVFLNSLVLKIHYQLFELERQKDSLVNAAPEPEEPPQITNMNSELAKMHVSLPKVKQLL